MVKRYSASKSAISIAPIFMLLVIGLLSGLLSGYLSISSFLNVPGRPNYLPPGLLFVGLLFGCGISCYFFIFQKAKSFIKLLGFVIMCGIAFLLSILFTASSMVFMFATSIQASAIDKTGIYQEIGKMLCFTFGGAIGTGFFLLGFHFLLVRLRSKEWLRLLLYGILLSAGSILFMQLTATQFNLNSDLLYALIIIPWQIGMAGAIGWIVATRK